MAAAPREVISYPEEDVEIRTKQETTRNLERVRNSSPFSVTVLNDKLFAQRQSAPVPDLDNSRRFHKSFSVSEFGNPQARSDRIKANIGPKNGSMVLQLVLPASVQNQNSNNNFENNNYLITGPSFEEILSNDDNIKRRTGNGSIESQQDIYSIASNECYLNQGYTNDLGDYGRSFNLESIPPTPVSTSTLCDHPKSTSQQEKDSVFRQHLTSILSSMYGIFIVTLGLVVYISDVIEGSGPIAETFSLYLVVIALIFILYLIFDIRMYMKRLNKYKDKLQKNVTEDIELKEISSGEFHLNIKLPEAAAIVRQLDHHYCLSKDRHSTNFYLKIGAAGFCVGHLIHSGLLLGYQILFMTSDGELFFECATVITLVLDIVYPIYSFFLLYFIFKYSNVVINRHMAVVRFGLMHCISSSLCFWVWTILRETIESLSNHYYEEENKDPDTHMSEVAFSKEAEGQLLSPVALPLTLYNRKGAQLLTAYLNTSTRHFTSHCKGDQGLSFIYRNYSPYLYPFSVEYSILVVGVLFVIWQSVGKCKSKEEMSSDGEGGNMGETAAAAALATCDTPEGSDDNLESNVVIHADCHSANKGLFGGIVIMVMAVVSIILFFIAINDAKYLDLGVFVNTITSVVIIFLMTITAIFLYRQITKLDVNKQHVSMLDDLLLFVCIPAFFLNGIFSIIPAIVYKSAISISQIVLEVTQVLVQTPLIIDGLRRCSNSRQLRKEKPGRELLTFLVVCNVAMWITQTFEVKSHGLQDHRYEFYGKELWTIIGHMCIPLMMFYRFHSSVCLADIWQSAYEPAGH